MRRRACQGLILFRRLPSEPDVARFPWHPVLRCSSWLLCWASGVDAVMAGAADDGGLDSHPHGSFGLVFAPCGGEVFEGTHMVHLDLGLEPHSSEVPARSRLSCSAFSKQVIAANSCGCCLPVSSPEAAAAKSRLTRSGIDPAVPCWGGRPSGQGAGRPQAQLKTRS